MPDQPDQNGEAVADVQSDCRDGGGGCEGDAGAEGGQGETEGEEGREPDCVDGCPVFVHAAEEGGDAPVPCEGEHHAGVAGEGEESGVVDT